MGGVSKLVPWVWFRASTRVDWHLVPIAAGGERPRPGSSHYPPTSRCTLASKPGRTHRPCGGRGDGSAHTIGDSRCGLPERCWATPILSTTDLWREVGFAASRPDLIRQIFRDPTAWAEFTVGLSDVSGRIRGDQFVSVDYTLLETAELWQTLYWLAKWQLAPRCPQPMPCSSLLLVGPRSSQLRPSNGTAPPVILSEHGVYVARGLPRGGAAPPRPPDANSQPPVWPEGSAAWHMPLPTAWAPVTDSHMPWERALGAHTRQVAPDLQRRPGPPARTSRTCGWHADNQRRPDSTRSKTSQQCCARPASSSTTTTMRSFHHYGPVSPANATYAAMCRRVHADLELGGRFHFMGPTSEPLAVMRAADIYLSTSDQRRLAPVDPLEAHGRGPPCRRYLGRRLFRRRPRVAGSWRARAMLRVWHSPH